MMWLVGYLLGALVILVVTCRETYLRMATRASLEDYGDHAGDLRIIATALGCAAALVWPLVVMVWIARPVLWPEPTDRDRHERL